MAADTLHFRVRSSSSDEVYKISAQLQPTLKISCSCPAGAIGSICKHRTALLLGDVTSVVEVDTREVETLGRHAAESPLGAAMVELTVLEKEAERIKKAIGGKKKQIARVMEGR